MAKRNIFGDEPTIDYPLYDPKRWATRKEWFKEVYEMGYYWIEDDYDENGEPRSK